MEGITAVSILFSLPRFIININRYIIQGTILPKVETARRNIFNKGNRNEVYCIRCGGCFCSIVPGSPCRVARSKRETKKRNRNNGSDSHINIRDTITFICINYFKNLKEFTVETS